MDLIMTFDSSAFFLNFIYDQLNAKTPFILSDFNDETEEFFFSEIVRIGPIFEWERAESGKKHKW